MKEITCPVCNKEMEQTDTTYSWLETERASKGQHTGDIYTCSNCDRHFIDNFLTEKLEDWTY